MSSIVISGDSSGAITLAAPSVAGTNTITLPASTGTVVTTGSPQSGSVIQVVYGRVANARFSTTSTSWVSLGSTLSITPKFSTSKILVRYFASAAASSSSADFYFDVARTISGVTTQNLSGISNGIASFSSTGAWLMIPVEYLDSPTTTSTVTYGASVAINSSSYTGYLNDNNGNTGTSFVLMEIAA